MLKSIELSGFKSFGKKTVMEFTSPISAIVGPNGSGKCVIGSTNIQLKDGSITTIKEMFDTAYSSKKRVQIYDDGVAVLENDADYIVPSINPQTLKQEWRPVTAFVRRTAPTYNIKITTRTGKEIIATPYHPVFTLLEGNCEAIKAEDLSTGIRIAVPRHFNIKGQLQEISLFAVASLFEKEDNVYIPSTQRLLSYLYERKAIAGAETNVALAYQCGIPSKILQSAYNGQSLNVVYAPSLFIEESFFKDRILKSKVKGSIRLPEYVDEHVARFLGYFIAEGISNTNGQVWFVNDDSDTIKDYISCAKKSFDITPKVFSYKESTKDVIIFSQTLSRILDKVFGVTQGGASRTKKVPRQIFASPNEIVSAFLSGLFDGDGHFCLKKQSNGKIQKYFEYASASEELVRGISSLLLRFGITSIVRKKEKCASNTLEKKKRTYWSLYVYGDEQLWTLAYNLDIKGRKRHILKKFKKLKENTNPNIDLIPGIEDLVRNVIKSSGIKVKSLRKEYPTLAAYAEKRCEVSRRGLTMVLNLIERYGNSTPELQEKISVLRNIASSDILWDEIVSLEKVRGDAYVYDLTIAENHNFVANNIFVHNSNTAEAFRFALGEQSVKSLRGKKTEDLIFNGSSGAPRSNRASVKVHFNNAHRPLNIDFDEVAIERVIHRDALHEYRINDSQVRLKDILEVLASANIGPTGHHIISQGEADHILSVHPRERKLIIEDALGLKIYHYKKKESERKLARTEENLKEIQNLEREIAPRLLFLQKQMNKIERARKLKEELMHLSTKYFASLNKVLTEKKEDLLKEQEEISQYLERLDKEKQRIMHELSGTERTSKYSETIAEYERERNTILQKKNEYERELGRVEGELGALKRTLEPKPTNDRVISLRLRELKTIFNHIFELISSGTSVSDIQVFIEETIGDFEEKKEEHSNIDTSLIEELQIKKSDLYAKIDSVSEKEKELSVRIQEARQRQDEELTHARTLERSLMEIEATIRVEENKLTMLKHKKNDVTEEESRFRNEVVELGIFLGREVAQYQDYSGELFDAHALKDVSRHIEKSRLKLEEANLGGAKDIEHEWEQVHERASFLAKEVHDLKTSRNSLVALIRDLDNELNKKFKEGIEKINNEFDTFFSIMFGGGSAHLEVVKIEPRTEEDMLQGSEEYSDLDLGIEIDVQLPRKRVQGLTMLSGGERSLVSIALIFAMSRINPPPFLILDETDAALDEANSRRYGDMIENLSEKSQLILITHNRETMSRAGLLYGVTMGSDGISRLLSIKFDEAQAMAAR